MSQNQSSKTIVILASGSGTNAEAIIQYFSPSTTLKIPLIISNNPEAKVLERSKNHHIPTAVYDRNDFYKTDRVRNVLQEIHPDLIILAGFLWKIPESIIAAFPRQIINIHPALLPRYGGKGMYGNHVHRAVLENHEKETGITIHYVDEHYDNGQIIAQFTTQLAPGETLESLLPKISRLEHHHYPRVIEKLLTAK